jgi:putative glycosyltransferase
LYYSAPYLDEFYARICATAEKITDDCEIILVNDGSPDNSLEIVLSLYERDKRVRVVDLSRNFRQHKAIMTGLAHAKGALVFLLDCDLEEEPELLGDFYDEFKSTDADVVYGVQRVRKGDFFERVSGNIFFGTVQLAVQLSCTQEPNNCQVDEQEIRCQPG